MSVGKFCLDQLLHLGQEVVFDSVAKREVMFIEVNLMMTKLESVVVKVELVKVSTAVLHRDRAIFPCDVGTSAVLLFCAFGKIDEDLEGLLCLVQIGPSEELKGCLLRSKRWL